MFSEKVCDQIAAFTRMIMAAGVIGLFGLAWNGSSMLLSVNDRVARIESIVKDGVPPPQVIAKLSAHEQQLLALTGAVKDNQEAIKILWQAGLKPR